MVATKASRISYSEGGYTMMDQNYRFDRPKMQIPESELRQKPKITGVLISISNRFYSLVAEINKNAFIKAFLSVYYTVFIS